MEENEKGRKAGDGAKPREEKEDEEEEEEEVMKSIGRYDVTCLVSAFE